MAFKKHDRGKSRLDLVPPRALELVGYLLAHGARVYSEDNWKECQEPLRYVSAGLRHAYKHLKGEFVDADTAMPHLAATAVNALIALELYLIGVEDKTMAGVYLAVVEKKSPTAKRGKVLRRFRGETGIGAYERAYRWMTSRAPGHYTIKTVGPAEKVGSFVSLPA